MEVTELKKEIEELKKENQELKEKLCKYTNPIFAKNYYENNKEKVLEKRDIATKKHFGEYGKLNFSDEVN